MNNLILSYELDHEPTYPTEEQAQEVFLHKGWDCLGDVDDEP